MNVYAMEIRAHVDEDAVDFDKPTAELAVYYDISGSLLYPVSVKAGREEVNFVHRVLFLSEDNHVQAQWVDTS